IYSFCKSQLKGIVSYTVLRNWCAGKISPSVNSTKVIMRLEEILGVEEGTLLNRLPRRLRGARKRPVGLTSYGKKMKHALKNKYGVWPPHVEQQLEKLTARMSSAARQEGDDRNSIGTSSDGKSIPTADIVQSYLRSIF